MERGGVFSPCFRSVHCLLHVCEWYVFHRGEQIFGGKFRRLWPLALNCQGLNDQELLSRDEETEKGFCTLGIYLAAKESLEAMDLNRTLIIQNKITKMCR